MLKIKTSSNKLLASPTYIARLGGQVWCLSSQLSPFPSCLTRILEAKDAFGSTRQSPSLVTTKTTKNKKKPKITRQNNFILPGRLCLHCKRRTRDKWENRSWNLDAFPKGFFSSIKISAGRHRATHNLSPSLPTDIEFPTMQCFQRFSRRQTTALRRRRAPQHRS